MTIDRSTPIIALVSRQGTACPETALRGEQDTPANRAAVEKSIERQTYSGPDKPLAGTWTDVTGNDFLEEN